MTLQVFDNSGATTQDWLRATEGMKLTAFDPSSLMTMESEAVEPDRAVNLPVAERARMNHAMPGVKAPRERL